MRDLLPGPAMRSCKSGAEGKQVVGRDVGGGGGGGGTDNAFQPTRKWCFKKDWGISLASFPLIVITNLIITKQGTGKCVTRLLYINVLKRTYGPRK